MKKINKQSQPEDLMKWYAENSKISPQNIKYNQAGFPRGKVLEALLKEQGYLCAYTLKRVHPANSHIEHLKPQCVCEAEDKERQDKGNSCHHEDVDWHNLVACFPGPQDEHPKYGALAKANWWDKSSFVSPLADNCEQRFCYTKDGQINPTNTKDEAAQETIDKLNLNCGRLQELRHTAILRAGIHPSAPTPIKSASQVQQLIRSSAASDRSARRFSVENQRVGRR